MEAFRISRSKYASELTASGVANRWNKDNEYILYTGSSRSLSTLELVVHRSHVRALRDYKMMVLSISDQPDLITEIKSSELPLDWRTTDAYPELQELGSDWYHSKRSLVLKVPSAVIPQEHNLLINTDHPNFLTDVKLVWTEDYFWDDRLLEGE